MSLMSGRQRDAFSSPAQNVHTRGTDHATNRAVSSKPSDWRPLAEVSWMLITRGNCATEKGTAVSTYTSLLDATSETA